MTTQRSSRTLVVQAPRLLQDSMQARPLRQDAMQARRLHHNRIHRLACGSIRFGLVLPLLLLTAGCSSRASDEWTAKRPKTYPAQGVVLHKGKPVDGATVVFNSAAENRAAFGVTDSAGRFTLTTFDSGDGAVAGAQQVRVTKVKTDKSHANPELSLEPPKETHLLPVKYADFKSSGLTADVKPDGENQFEFDLAD